MNLVYFYRFSINTRIQNFMKIRYVGAQLFQWEGQADRHVEANSRFSEFCERP